MIAALHVIGQWLDWRRAKRCLAGKHRWMEFKHPYKKDVILIRCKWCHTGIEKMGNVE